MQICRRLVILGVLIVFGVASLGCDDGSVLEGDDSGSCRVSGPSGGMMRIGPFATQSTAIQRRQEYAAEGCSVSQGTFPCFEDFTRGYCFNVFF